MRRAPRVGHDCRVIWRESMSWHFAIMVLAASAVLAAGSAQAGDAAAMPLRLIGEAPTMGAGEARHFVIDARVTRLNGYPEIKGWLAALPPETG